MSLHRTHPNFFVAVIGDLYATLLAGLGFLFIDNTSPTFRYVQEIAPLEVFGLALLIAFGALLVGLFNHPVAFRFGLVLSAGLSALFAIGMTAAIIDDLVFRGDTPATWGAVLAGGFVFQFIAQAAEPRTNPDSQHR